MEKFFNIKKFGLGLAIIVVFNLFVGYGINTFYKAPEYQDFCKPERVKTTPIDRISCEVIGGLWTENSNYKIKPVAPGLPAEPRGYCDQDYSCRKNFDTQNNLYRRNVFIVWVVVGLLAIAVGFFLKNVATLPTSFMFAGILSLIIGSIQYWSAMQDYLRFIILGAALAVLIWIAYKKLEK